MKTSLLMMALVASAGCHPPPTRLSWQNTSVPAELLSVWGVDDQHVFVAGGGGALFFSSDAGSTWTSLPNAMTLGGGVASTFWDIDGSGLSDMYLVGATVADSSDAGVTWTERFPNAGGLLSAWIKAPGDLLVVGKKGTILHSVDRGATWSTPTSGTELTLWGVWGSGPNDIYVVGGSSGSPGEPAAGSIILHSTDGGATWPPRTGDTATGFGGIWGSGANDVFVGSDDGVILHSIDGGNTWLESLRKSGFGFSTGWTNGHGDVYAIAATGGYGALLHSPDDGASWALDFDHTCSMTDIWGSPTGRVYVTCDDGSILLGSP